MKTRIFLSLLGLACFTGSALAQCNLTGSKADAEDFPDITKYVGDSYIMGVEYSTPLAKETDYFTEYYEVEFKRGRIESHIRDKNEVYIYRSESAESWTLANGKCNYTDLTATPDFFKSDETEWMHFTGGEVPSTLGPSAMLKNAYDAWKSKDRKDNMAYMGPAEELIRGERAVLWRRCTNDKKNYIDYYFADQKEENPFDTGLFKKQITPLRVSFFGVSPSTVKQLSQQHYDIISFQHFIPAGFEPFQLPKGKNCSRSKDIEGPKIPDFSSQNLFINSEVVYQQYRKGSDEPLGTYYSTFQFALDRRINHLAYYYSSWNVDPKKQHPEDEQPLVKAPEYIVYDMFHAYAYNISRSTGSCEISRRKAYIPTYELPKNRGTIDLTNPLVLLPNNEMSFLTYGTVRGMPVNIYETSVEGFITGDDKLIPKALVTHSYLQSNIKLETKSEVSGALIQIQLRLFRTDGTEDVLTFNLFGFSTEIPMRQRVFDVTRCYKNADDYTIFTIGFEVEPKDIPKLPKALPEIEKSVINVISSKSELNYVRIPYSMSNIKDGYVFVTMVVLGKPPLALDFPDPEEGKTIVVANPDDTEGIATLELCSGYCLEEIDDCWGFSKCGATCYYGTKDNLETVEKKNCTLYTKYTDKFMQSLELQIQNLIHFVNSGTFRVMARFDDGEVDLTASYTRLDDPTEGDNLFRRLGNRLNPRMKVQKAATKLKGEEVRNMGKIMYDECQSLCLDFKDCETISYCLKKSCVISNKYASELSADEVEADDFCILLSRKYTDHFDHTPGVIVKAADGTSKEVKDVEECSRACLMSNETDSSCLSFDHCMVTGKQTCILYTTHFLSRQDKEDGTRKEAQCGHYTKKYSYDFKRKDKTRMLGSGITPITNLTLEECAKTCIDYGNGTCQGYDFCQGGSLYDTSCTLIDKDPAKMNSTASNICTNYVRSLNVIEEVIVKEQVQPRPYTTGYAGGIGFVCFLVGGILGAVAVFVIAYIRVNKRS